MIIIIVAFDTHTHTHVKRLKLCDIEKIKSNRKFCGESSAKMTTTQLSSLAGGAVLLLCFANAARAQVDGWKPIVGTASYSRLTQHLPSATINVENGDSIAENSVTFHGSHLVGAAGGVEDPILSVASGSVVNSAGTEGRFLGDISSDYVGSSSKGFNGLYSSGGVSVN